MVADWRNTCTAAGCNYLNADAFVRVPVSSVTTATIRPGNYRVGQVRGPGKLVVELNICQELWHGGRRRLQIRADVFNVLNMKNFGGPGTNITRPTSGESRAPTPRARCNWARG